MPDEKDMDVLWNIFARANERCERNFAGIAADKDAVALSRAEIVGLLRELRDARRAFMEAAGAFDDAWISGPEGKAFAGAAYLSAIVEKTFAVTDEEIERAELPFTTSTGRKTATPQFPSRFDM